eukprot:11963-Chlamydomonas_euryale.AAC.6
MVCGLQTGRLNVVWELCLMPNDGWQPSWMLPLQIGIAFVCLLVAGGSCHSTGKPQHTHPRHTRAPHMKAHPPPPLSAPCRA